MSFYSEIIGFLGLKELGASLDYNIINYGGKAVYIDGFLGVQKIERDEVILAIKDNKIIVSGQLSIHSLEERSIIIKGKIKSVRLQSFEEGAVEKNNL